MNNKTDYEKNYDEFWKNIVEDNGELILNQIKRELFDYSVLMDNVSKVYCYATNGNLSKLNYDSKIVIEQIKEAQYDDLINNLEDFISDMKLEGKTNFSENDLRKYFNIGNPTD